ncbi:hypothetical protein SAMN04488065_2949 [Haloplanus vescus]|uniref:Transposase IS4-like domain-containing protein n=1 Tax=Haloplanus vescus TaxID=555874 RepID=A0A1H4AVP7_9EURY|nr:transposase [Haloplanus vescus]SEA39927.1 hypothetical protein SAMN04488065_2949 [Haloplanus vescus]
MDPDDIRAPPASEEDDLLPSSNETYREARRRDRGKDWHTPFEHGAQPDHPGIEHAIYALRYFKNKLAPDTDLLDNWEELDDKQQRWYCAGLLKLHFDDDYRSLEDRLTKWSQVAGEAGFNSQDIPHYSTFSRHLRDLDEEVLAKAAQRASNAALHQQLAGGTPFDLLGTNPSKPRSYYELLGKDWEVSMDKKMTEATEAVAEYLALTIPHLRFDRDQMAPNFQYPIQSFYQLLAHLALEDCYAENGAELLRWLSDDDIDIPPPSTVRTYAKQYGVEQHEERFFNATCALFERMGLSPQDQVHFAYDITTDPWYGKENRWVTGSVPEDNTNQFWHYAVLSIVPSDQNEINLPCRNYILGATPIKDRTEIAEALDRMLNRVQSNLDLDLGRIYLDRQMYQGGVVTKCREHGLNWVIQAPKKGEARELISKTPLSKKTNKRTEVDFSDLDYSHRNVNLFVSRLHEDEIGRDDLSFTPSTEITNFDDADNSDRTNSSQQDSSSSKQLGEYGFDTPEPTEEPTTSDEGEQARGVGDPDTHSAWITDLDIETRDIRGLAYQFRNRWKIETAIRQLKHDFLGQCGSSDRRVRALYMGTAQLFFNFWVALNRELPHRLGDPEGFRLTGQEILHAVREADVEAAKTGGSNTII